MNIAILILKDVLKSTAYGIEELFHLNNISCKSKEEVEIKTTFVSLKIQNILKQLLYQTLFMM